MVKDIRGHVKELSAYARKFDEILALRTAQALACDQLRASLIINSLYLPEAQATAATAGFIEELAPIEAVLCFQVLTALYFEKSNGRISRLISSTKRDHYAMHIRIVQGAESTHSTLIHGPVVNRFAERFGRLAENS